MRLLLTALVVAGACTKGATNLCSSDTQCAAGFFCDPATGACRCAGDSSCAAAETCNAAGFCQPRLSCDSTADCADGTICDTVSGVCIEAGSCSTLDVQCAAGQVCKDFACVPGCRHDGDCAAPSDVCRPCPAGTSASDCPTGSLCVRGKCDTQLTCHYGDLCSPDGTGDTVCTADTRGPYCQTCTRSAGSSYYCSDPITGLGNGNYCLIDPSQPLGDAFFCGVDCSAGQACPFGYYCHDVRIVTAVNCDQSAGLSACGPVPGSVPCDPSQNHAGAVGGIVNDACENAGLVGAVCDPKTSQCVPQCLGTGETGVQAFCSCVEDSDCPPDFCDSSRRACTISGKSCIPGMVPDDCQSIDAIRCVKAQDPRLGNVGYCKIGANCAPDQGYTCSILLSGQ